MLGHLVIWFDAKATLTEIRSVKSLKVSRIDAEPILDRISTNSTISTAGCSNYENSHQQENNGERCYDAVRTVFDDNYFLDGFNPDAWR